MKSLLQGPWKWIDCHREQHPPCTALARLDDEHLEPQTIFLLSTASSGTLSQEQEAAKTLIQEAPALRDCLYELAHHLGRVSPGSMAPELSVALSKAVSLLDRVTSIRLPGVWEVIEDERLYLKTYATEGVWLEAHLYGTSIVFRAKRNLRLDGVLQAAQEVACSRAHALDPVQIACAVEEVEQALSNNLRCAMEKPNA